MTEKQGQAVAQKTAHTPGPRRWSTRQTYQSQGDPVFWFRDVINNGGTIRVAKVSGVGQERTEAYARLIAAAPDMLAALLELTNAARYCREYGGDVLSSCSWIKAEKAIAKATGRE